MKKLDLKQVAEYVNKNIDTFHQSRVRLVADTTLKKVINKNPYLSRAKNVNKASQLVDGALSARLSSSEEELFGQFLEDLAIYIAEKTTGGHKAGTAGVDLEFDNNNFHYFVSIKSGPNWGNKDQHDSLDKNLRNAINAYKQRKGQLTQADSVLGICYGKVRTVRSPKGYLKLVGQNFWTFISGNKDLYKDIIEPIGYRAKEHNEAYEKALDNVSNRLEGEFIKKFCNKDGSIKWNELVEATCGNYDLNKHGFDF